MKKTGVLLTIIVLASAGAAFAAGNTLPPPAYPQKTYQPPVAYAPQPAVYAPAPVVYYTPPPVVYYTPPPPAYASPYPYNGYGCDPLFGFLSLVVNYDGGSDHHDHDGGYYNSGRGGGYNHYGQGRSYYRSGKSGGYGNRGGNSGYFRPGNGKGSGIGKNLYRLINDNSSGKHGNAGTFFRGLLK
jgi:hypothetical protein